MRATAILFLFFFITIQLLPSATVKAKNPRQQYFEDVINVVVDDLLEDARTCCNKHDDPRKVLGVACSSLACVYFNYQQCVSWLCPFAVFTGCVGGAACYACRCCAQPGRCRRNATCICACCLDITRASTIHDDESSDEEESGKGE